MLKRTKHTTILLLAIAATSGLVLSGQVNAQEFSYNGDTGPGFWSELNPDAWEACAGGPQARQSPIDISRFRMDKSLQDLELSIYPTTINIFSNGHTIEQEYEGTGSLIYFEGIEYELKQFHFHTLSEHTVGGKHGVMELHAVFQNDGSYLVVGMLFDIGTNENRFIQTLIDAGLPEKDGDDTETGDQIDLAAALAGC